MANALRGLIGLSALILVTTACAPASCDRQCLIDLTDQYLAAIVAHDPAAVPLADDIGFVENITRMQPGEGLWASAVSGPTGFAIHVPDVDLQQAGFMGIMQRAGPDGNPQNVLVAVRLKIEDGKIAEAEHIIAGVDNMQRLQQPRPGLVTEVPPGSRQSHDDLAAIGLSYYDALDDNDGSLMPFADDCQRHENGMVTAGPEAGLGPNASSDQAPVAKLCAPQLDSQSFVYIDRIEDRRLVAADPAAGRKHRCDRGRAGLDLARGGLSPVSRALSPARRRSSCCDRRRPGTPTDRRIPPHIA